MIGKEKLKYLASLKQKKRRKSEGKILVEGVRSVSEGLKSDYVCEEIFVVKDAKNLSEIISLAKKRRIKITEVGSLQLKKITDTIHPQNVAALFEIRKTGIKTDDLILAFDAVSDPGNLGTLIRTADWFGVKNLLISCDSVEITNPKVIRSTMGSFFHVNYKCAENFTDELLKLKRLGFQIVLADLNGEDVSRFDGKNRKSVLVLSNEAKGASESVREVADVKVAIAKLGAAESLNVSVAGGILLYEFTKAK